MARVLRLMIATALVGLMAVGAIAWRAFPLTSPAEARPAPLSQSDGAALLGPDGGACAGPTDGTRDGPSLARPGADAVPRGGCIALTGPTPVIAEAPLPILLPLTATAALGGAALLVRRRGKAQQARGKEAADGE